MVVSGDNFDNTVGATFCKFGSNEPVVATVLSASRLRCITLPNINDGPVPIEVTCDGMVYTSQRVQFTYREAVMIAFADPSSASEIGGASIVVTGSHFSKYTNYRCAFGSAEPTPAVFINTSKLKCKTPAHIPTVTELHLVDADSQWLTFGSSVPFTFQPHMVVSSVMLLACRSLTTVWTGLRRMSRLSSISRCLCHP